MFGNLRKKLNETWSGSDFWDKKENQGQRQYFAQTRSQAPKAPPAQTIAKPRQSVGNKFRDVFDANTEMDKFKRVSSNQPKLYRDQQIAMGNKRPYENLGAQIVGNTARFGNTARYGVQQGIETAKGQTAVITKNEKALAESLKRQKQNRDVQLKPNSGLLGTGTIYNSPEEGMNLGNAEIAKRVGFNTLGTASEILPFARVARPVVGAGKGAVALYKGGKPLTGTTGKAIKAISVAERGGKGLPVRMATNAGIDVASGAGESVARQYAQTGKIDPKLVAADSAANLVLGQAQMIPAVGKYAVTPGKLTPAQQAKRDSFVQLYNNAEVKGNKQMMSFASKEIDSLDAVQSSPVQRQINKRVKDVSADGIRKYGDSPLDPSQLPPNIPQSKLSSQSSKNSISAPQGKTDNPFEKNLEKAGLKPTQAKTPKTPQEYQPKQTKNIKQPIQDQPKVASKLPSDQAAYPDRATLKVSENRQRIPLRQQSEEIYSESPQRRPSTNKLQQKTPVVNEAKRAIDGADRTTYGLRDSFDTNDNVPKELKEALGAFGNERTVRSNKELWQTAQKRVVDDPAEAMRYFKDNNSDDAVATGYALINRNMKEGNVTAAGEISIEMAERALETGRTNQAYALMKRLTPEGSISYVEKKVQRFIRDNPNMAKKVGWDDKVRKELYEMADQVNKLPEGRERNLAIGKMQEKIDNIFPSSLADKAVTVWKAGLLTSLRTHERNILGNTINMVGEQSATVPGSLADRIMSLRTGKRTLTATPGRNMGSGAKVGGQIAKDQIMTGIDVNNTNIKYNINHVTWGDNKVEKVLKGYTEGVFRPLGAEDKIFKESIRANSLYNQAAAEAKTKGLKGDAFDNFVQEKIKNPTAKMMDIADDDASRGTFTHDNFLGDVIKNAKGAVRKSNKPGAKAFSAFLDILMPFTQVPSGVASQLYAYSPAKLIKSSYDIGRVLVTGDETLQRQAAQGFGRSVIGTSIIGAGAYLAANGLMTGDPKDDAEKAQWEAQGIKPNSVKIGDRWYGLQSVGPQFVLALAGAQMVADQENGDNPYTKLAANIGNNFSEQTFIKGMSSFVDAIKEPERNLDFYVQSQATSVVPNLVKDISRAVDPNERQTNNIWDKFKGTIPGVSTSLPERKDSYGQTIKNSGALEIVDLFNSSKEKEIPEAKYIDALRDSTGEKDHVPTKADKTITINGESKKLNSKEYSDYQNFIGSMGKQVIGRLKDDPAFRALPETEQVKKIDSALRDINSAAKIKLFGNDSKDSSSNIKKMANGEFPNISTKITTASGVELPQNINQSARRILESDTGEADWLTQDSKEQDVKNTLTSWLPKGVQPPKVTNDIAKQWATLEKKKAEGTLGKIEEESERKTILKNAYNSELNEDEKDLYSLSEDRLIDALDRGLITDENVSKALAVEKKLYDAGLISKETLARKFDLAARGYKTGKGGKGGKGKTKKANSDDFKLYGFGKPSSQYSGQLQRILEKYIS